MPRLRAFFVGMLILLGFIFAAEYAVERHSRSMPEALRVEESLYGWEPSSSLYLAPPQQKTYRRLNKQGAQVLLHYEDHGFRVSQASAAEQSRPPLFSCLGDQLVLSPELNAEQTFVSLWKKLRERNPGGVLQPEGALPASEIASAEIASEIVNAAMPDGCPLLWQLHRERLSSLTGSHWLCFFHEGSIANDFRVRRTLEVDVHGLPAKASHPLATKKQAEGEIVSAGGERLEDKKLTRIAMGWVSRALLGEESGPTNRIDSLSASHRGGAKSGHQLRLCLLPCLRLKSELAANGGKLTLVYLPGLNELDEISPASTEGGQPVSLSAAASGQNSTGRVRDNIREFAVQHELAFLDLTPAFQKIAQRKLLYLADGNQLSESGHNLVALLLEQHFYGLSPVPANLPPRAAQEPFELPR